jgi:hypothetical protein
MDMDMRGAGVSWGLDWEAGKGRYIGTYADFIHGWGERWGGWNSMRWK